MMPSSLCLIRRELRLMARFATSRGRPRVSVKTTQSERCFQRSWASLMTTTRAATVQQRIASTMSVSCDWTSCFIGELHWLSACDLVGQIASLLVIMYDRRSTFLDHMSDSGYAQVRACGPPKHLGGSRSCHRYLLVVRNKASRTTPSISEHARRKLKDLPHRVGRLPTAMARKEKVNDSCATNTLSDTAALYTSSSA